MNFKTTLILLVLLVVVGGVVMLTSRNGDADQATDTKKTETEQKVLAVDTADVEQFTVEQAGGDKLALERKAGVGWQLTAPVKAAAEAWQVDSLVREVAELKSRNRVPLDAAAQGLAKPAYTVTLKDKSGKTSTLAVGAHSAVGDALYVKLDNEDKAHVVAGTLVEQLAKPAMSYRQAKLVEATLDSVEGLTFTRAGEPTIKVDKIGFSEWKMTEPVAMPAEPSEITGLITALTGMSATEFVAEDSAAKAAQYGLDKPALLVSVRTKPSPGITPTAAPTVGSSTGGPTTTAPAASQPAPIVVRLGRYVDVLKKDVYAAVEGGPVVKLPATTLDSFKKMPLELRDKKVVNIDPESVERVTITRDLQATTQPSKRDASKGTVVVARRVEKFAPAGPPAPAPAAKPEDAKPAGAKSDATGAIEGDAVLAAAEEKAAAPTDAARPTDVPKADAATPPDAPRPADAPKPAEAVKPDAAAPAPAVAAAETKPAATSPATSQAATAPAASQPAVSLPPPSKYVLESEPKGDASDAKVQALLDAIHPLRVQKYLAAAPKDVKPVGTYTLKVETASSAGKAAQTYEIQLTDSGTGGLVAQYGDVHFEAERSLLAKLEGGFEKGTAVPEPPMSFPGPGGPGGGLPPGFGGPPGE